MLIALPTLPPLDLVFPVALVPQVVNDLESIQFENTSDHTRIQHKKYIIKHCCNEILIKASGYREGEAT